MSHSTLKKLSLFEIKSSPNTGGNDSPRAIKGTPCGEAGRYIRLSSDYVSDNFSGAAAVDLYHEWAKFKWGVFPSKDNELRVIIYTILLFYTNSFILYKLYITYILHHAELTLG